MKRQQAPKVRNEQYMRDMQELRRSNAAGAHKNKAAYSRKQKHRKGWE